MKKRWHILGAGAIGNLWACHLTSAGFPVTLILRSQDKLDSFSAQSGIKLKEELFLTEAELADSPAPIEQLLITTKSTDTQIAFDSIRSRISSHARVIVLQNGMGTQQWVREQLPSAEVVWASTTDGAWLKQPFELVHAGQGYTRMGIPDQECYWLEELGNGFLKIELDDDILKTLWRKLAINCAINPLTAHFQCKNGELINNPDYLVEMAAICREVETVTNAAGIKLFDGPLIEHACQVAELTAENFSSMMQDVKHSKTTEISSITGYLCKLAEQHNITIPVNQKYLKKIQELQEKR